jgi:hypothetical protein
MENLAARYLSIKENNTQLVTQKEISDAEAKAAVELHDGSVYFQKITF